MHRLNRSENIQSSRTPVFGLSLMLGSLLAVTIAGLALAEPEFGGGGEWNRFKARETLIKSSTSSSTATDSMPSNGQAGAAGQFQPTQQSYFVVPGYFANQPKPNERPTETFRAPTLLSGSAQSNAGINAFAATLPFTTGIGYGYGGWLGGWGGPGPGYGYGYGFGGPTSFGVAALGASAAFMGGGAGSFGSGFGIGGPLGLASAISPFGGGYWGGGWRGYGNLSGRAGYGGLGGWGGYGGLGGWGGYGGLGGWGGYGGPGGWGGYSGLGGWGGGPWGWYGGSFGAAGLGASAAFMSGGSQTGVVTPTNVIQSAPSKPSGNYYAPSTADPSASGGYYATTAPAAIPMMQQKAPVTNFWGGSGSPLPKDINSVPWAK
jgi:hypothetical protein